jgi:transposase
MPSPRLSSHWPRLPELDGEAKLLAKHIDTLTTTAAPDLRAVYGVGPDTAATLLAAIGDNHDRISSDAAFAKLCGVCPLEASSGKTIPSAWSTKSSTPPTPAAWPNH